jgi:hypothetical protein
MASVLLVSVPPWSASSFRMSSFSMPSFTTWSRSSSCGAKSVVATRLQLGSELMPPPLAPGLYSYFGLLKYSFFIATIFS